MEKAKGRDPGLDVKSTPTMTVLTRLRSLSWAKPCRCIRRIPRRREAAAFINEKSEGMVGQGGVSVPDALSAQLEESEKRTRLLGPGMYRLTAEEELQRDQKAAGTRALLKRLNEYDGGNVRRTRSY